MVIGCTCARACIGPLIDQSINGCHVWPGPPPRDALALYCVAKPKPSLGFLSLVYMCWCNRLLLGLQVWQFGNVQFVSFCICFMSFLPQCIWQLVSQFCFISGGILLWRCRFQVCAAPKLVCLSAASFLLFGGGIRVGLLLSAPATASSDRHLR